jgi:uracil-DNA glycosylase
MRPDCESFVPGCGDANADFHLVGDRPGVHGGVDAGVPFTGEPWSSTFFEALADGGLIDPLDESTDESTADEADPFVTGRTFASYLHMCVTDEAPDEAAYADMERFFDAELRAIAAHVLLPVGARATDHVLRQYTSRAHKTPVDMDALHATELLGSGWLVLPIKDPGEWTDADPDRLVAALRDLQSTDFRRESDLGRFIPGSDPYLVR